jgi:hypothetical protein
MLAPAHDGQASEWAVIRVLLAGAPPLYSF